MDQSPANLYIHNIISVYSGYPNCFPGFHAHNLSVVSLQIKGHHIGMGPVCLKDIPHASRRRPDYKKSSVKTRTQDLLQANHPTISLIVPLDGKVIFTYIPLYLFGQAGKRSVSQKKLTCSNLEEFCPRGRWKSCGFHEIQEARACHVSILFILNRPMSLDEMSSLGTLQIS